MYVDVLIKSLKRKFRIKVIINKVIPYSRVQNKSITMIKIVKSLEGSIKLAKSTIYSGIILIIVVYSRDLAFSPSEPLIDRKDAL